MSSNVSESPAAADVLLESPGQGGIRICRPILQVSSPEVQDFTDRTLIDVFLRQLDGGGPAIVEGNHRVNAIFFCGQVHGLCFGGGHGQRLFAEDVLMGLCRGDGDFGVYVVGGADINNLD